MQIVNSIFIFIFMSLAFLASANPIEPRLVTRATATSNFSSVCTDIYAYPGDKKGSIRAACYGVGGQVLSISYLDLNKCLANHDGVLARQTNGGAMASCSLGPNGRNLCGNDCNTSNFQFNCNRSDNKGIATFNVNLDDYIGVSTNIVGRWVLSCGTDSANLGMWTNCNNQGQDDPNCSVY